MGGLSQGVEEEAVAGLKGAHDGQRKGSQGSLEESTPGLRKPQGEGSARSTFAGGEEEQHSHPVSVHGMGSFGPWLRSYLQRGCRLLFCPRRN